MSSQPRNQVGQITITVVPVQPPIIPNHVALRKDLACYWIDSFSPKARPVFVRIEQKGRRDSDVWKTIVTERFENRGQLPAYTQAREYAISVVRMMEPEFPVRVTLDTDDLV